MSNVTENSHIYFAILRKSSTFASSNDCQFGDDLLYYKQPLNSNQYEKNSNRFGIGRTPNNTVRATRRGN